MKTATQMKLEPFCHVVDLITTDEDKKFAPAGRLASAIIKITQETGACQQQDLEKLGFTPAEISKHWHIAQSLAAVEMRL
ncbi:MAG: hypothetical protein PHX43_09525 [Alphaproteobacteria bacterium]|nr:hypothetical protein [Alphaproteobacteria bacterium]